MQFEQMCGIAFATVIVLVSVMGLGYTIVVAHFPETMTRIWEFRYTRQNIKRVLRDWQNSLKMRRRKIAVVSLKLAISACVLYFALPYAAQLARVIKAWLTEERFITLLAFFTAVVVLELFSLAPTCVSCGIRAMPYCGKRDERGEEIKPPPAEYYGLLRELWMRVIRPLISRAQKALRGFANAHDENLHYSDPDTAAGVLLIAMVSLVEIAYDATDAIKRFRYSWRRFRDQPRQPEGGGTLL